VQIRDRIRELRRVRASDLLPSPRNWRTHPKSQQDALRGVLAEVGYADALLAREVDGGRLMLVDGHLRAETTPDSLVPVLVLDVTEAEADKLLATLDSLAAMATADAGKLDALLRDVRTGSEAVAAMLAQLAGENPVAPPETPQGHGGDDFDAAPEEGPTRTAPGDLWVIGGVHRLLVGDCTAAENVARLMGGEKAAVLVTSPPYWANQEYDGKPGLSGIKTFMQRLATAWSSCVTRRVCINTGNTNARSIGEADTAAKVLLDSLWAAAWQEAGWMLRTRRIWVKGGICLHQNPAVDCVDDSCEALLTFFQENRGGMERIAEPWANQGYWDMRPEKGVEGHPCPFPVELPSRFIRLYSSAGDIVADPCLGSGTTLVAAHRLGRRCFGCELEPRYADVALRRAEAEGLACEKLS
jgi:DNA modification methylase